MQGINDNHVSVAFKKSCHALVVVHKMRPIAVVAYVRVRLSVCLSVFWERRRLDFENGDILAVQYTYKLYSMDRYRG